MPPRYRAWKMERGAPLSGQLWESLAAARDFIIRCYNTLKSCALWIAHLPKSVASSISRWIHAIGSAISAVVHAIKVAIVVVTISLITVIIVYTIVVGAIKLLRRYQQHRQVEQENKLREQAEQRRREELFLRVRKLEAEAKILKEENERHRREQRQKEEREAERKHKDEQDRRRKREQRQRQQGQEKRRRAESDQNAYQDWQKRCDNFRENREASTTFPAPPTWPCTTSPPCDRGILDACRHSIERLYRASGRDIEEVLKRGKLEWHPDKFAKCRSSCREEMQKKATQMFQIIQQLEDQLGRNRSSR